MTILSRWILVLGLGLAIDSSALAQSAAPPVPPPDWPVTSAPARFTIQPDEGGMKLISRVKLFLPDARWAAQPMRVFTDAGIAVGSDLLWSAPGEPATLLFDSSSGSKQYRVYLGSNWPPVHLPDPKAGVWLETRAGDGKSINALPDMLQAWNQSQTVLGRALLNGIFEGGNRFGPQVNLFQHFQGWFDAPAPEHLQFATVSVDASFVLVDGKEVVQWPGIHERWYDNHVGPPQGAVDLAAGTHVVDYYYAYVKADQGPPATSTLAVNGGNIHQWTMLTVEPETNFFRPVSHAHAESYDLQTSPAGGSAPVAAPPLAFEWLNHEDSDFYTDVPDIGFISVQLTCLVPVPPTGTLTWTFDDGSTAQGQSLTHVFPRPGLRQVHLSLADGGKEVAALNQTISVHPEWAHPTQDARLYPQHEADIMSRDPATLSASDLASCYAIFQSYHRTDDLLKLLPALCAKMKDVNEADLPYLKDGAVRLSRDKWDHIPEEIQLLRALLDRVAAAQPTPPLAVVDNECRLALARLILKTSESTDDVRSVLKGINSRALVDNEGRILALLQADLAMAAGDVEGARKQYQSLTAEPSGPDARSSIRRTARIGQARAFIDRKDFTAADDALNDVAWEDPIDKMSPDWGLTRLRLYQEQNLQLAAYLWAKRELPVITDSGRSELLFRLTGLAFAQGDNALAQKTLSELLQKHPYSEEAAQAKEKWPGKG